MSNSLASVHPELIPEWSERNLPLTPDKIAVPPYEKTAQNQPVTITGSFAL